jgi:hypothetical protein
VESACEKLLMLDGKYGTDELPGRSEHHSDNMERSLLSSHGSYMTKEELHIYSRLSD